MLFVRSGAVTEVFCLLGDFFIREEEACPPKISGASTSALPSIPAPLENPIDVDGNGCVVLLEESLQDMDSSDHPFDKLSVIAELFFVQ